MGTSPSASLIQATDGNIYGTTEASGANGGRTVYKITPSGTLTTLYSFCSQSNCNDGYNPYFGPVQGTDGTLYGTTAYGGANGYGTVFKISLTGALTTLYSFCSQSGCTDGARPYAAPIQATDGNFYGTTVYGGNSNSSLCSPHVGCGTVFKITPTGALTTLYSFCSQSGCVDGSFPIPGLVQDTNGALFGTTNQGGNSGACSGGCGTVFTLSVGLSAFVKPEPTSGKVGATVKILGTNLTGATSVTFNGTAAVFKVVSTLIGATVPAGATSGTVEVTTPLGTLTSNVPFRIEP